MEQAFWHERWEQGQTGFHQEAVNARLEKHWPSVEPPSGAQVFVPLCGKSLDLHWLRKRGYDVVGVELSPIAIRDFFAEAGIASTIESHGALTRHRAPGFDLLCGDFFDLTRADLAEVRAVYDRGSLVALPKEMRSRYAEHLVSILPADTSCLLLTVEYDQSRMSGPPHSVPLGEIEDLFGHAFEVECLESFGPGDAPPMFQARGLDSLEEHVVALRPSAPR